MGFSSLDITGRDEHPAPVSGETGRGGIFPVFPLFSARYGGRRYFRESKNVHFCELMRERLAHP